MKILYSGFISKNHSSNGGYDKIIDNPLTTDTIISNNFPLWNMNKKYHLRKIPLWTSDLCTRIKRFNYDITHLFYGEITMFPFLSYYKSNKHKLVITLHLDIEQQHFHKFFIQNLKQFDGIIVLSSQQQDYYKKKYGIETIFIPHGFNKPLFNKNLPLDSHNRCLSENNINILISGQNYRDFITLERIINVFKNNTTITFHIVGSPKNIKNRLMNFSENVHVYPRIPDDEYYTLIKMCDYNFLPLTFATANNALLEAQAIGTPSILPNIAGIADYAAPEPLNYFYNTFDQLVTIIENLDKQNENQNLIRYSEQFNWDNVYAQLNNFYRSLI